MVRFALDGLSMGMLGKGWACLGLTAVPGAESTVEEASRQRAMEALNGGPSGFNLIDLFGCNSSFLQDGYILPQTFRISLSF